MKGSTPRRFAGPARCSRLVCLISAFVCQSGARLTWGDDTPLSLADLPAYQAALRSSPELAANPVTFRDLWDRPSVFQGRRVEVAGRVERVFHQPAVGQLPALAEAWVVTPTKDPLCLVFPDAEVAPGSMVSFAGDYIKRLRYGGSDTDRLAPLIVGPRAPLVVTPAPPPTQAPVSGSQGLEFTFGLVVLMVVLAGFVRVFVRRPRFDRRSDIDPDPVFEDGPPLV